MSSSARKRKEGPAESFAKSWCEIPPFARDDTFVVFVFVIVFVLYDAHDAMPSAPARAVNTAMRTLRSLLKFTFFIMIQFFDLNHRLLGFLRFINCIIPVIPAQSVVLVMEMSRRGIPCGCPVQGLFLSTTDYSDYSDFSWGINSFRITDYHASPCSHPFRMA